MSIKAKVGCLLGFFQILIPTGIWYYLLFQIMALVQASETMWIMYWIYMPVGFLLSLTRVIVDSIFEDLK